MKLIIEHKNIIFGLGQSGMSCAHYFDRVGVNYTLVDTRSDNPIKKDITLLKNCQASYFGIFDETILNSCERLIVSPGISLENSFVCQAKKRNIDICGDVELFARECDKTIVAITGSNGKSTVTELTQKLISASGITAQMAGNIGLPVLDYLARSNQEDNPEIFVLELSSFQLDLTTSLKADVAVLLNISEDHMDRYNSFNNYIESKKSVFNGAKKKIFNLDDKRCHPSEVSDSDYAFSIDDTSNKNTHEYKCKISRIESETSSQYNFRVNNNRIIDSTQLNIIGNHNYANVLASLSILDQLNINIDKNVLNALSEYKGMKHRFQLVSKQFNCNWINDSKATNVGATIAALENFKSKKEQRLILIAGGDSKQSDLNPLEKEFEDKVESLILLGKDAKLIASLSNKIKFYFVKNMQQAIEKAKSLLVGVSVTKQDRQSTRPTTVLLSPACASLDMFKNFEDRGEQFTQAIEVLK